jgi:MFS family permease
MGHIMVIPSERDRNQILLVLFLGVLMAALDIAIVGPALPALKVAFATDDQALTWVFTLYMVVNLIGTPIIAQLSDRFGRRSLYLASVSLFALGSLLVALAPSFAILLLGRAIQGIGAGGIFPVASAVIGDTFPAEKRGAALGLIGAVFGIAFLIGPILGGVLLLLGWQWLFLINLPIAVGIIVLGMRLLPAGGARSSEQAALGETFRLFRNRQIALVAALALGAGLSEAVTLFIPSLLVGTFGVTPSAASFMLIPMVVAMAVSSPISGRVLDSHGSRIVIVLGAGLLGLSLLLEGAFAANLLIYYLFSVIFGLGIGILLGAALRYIILNEAQPSQRATAQGLLTIAISLGQIIGAGLIGLILTWQAGLNGYASAFLLSGAIMLALALAATRLKGRSAEQATMQRQSAVGV